MTRIVIFGNSGSGKSTLARALSEGWALAHLDLDTLAWQAGTPPRRLPVQESAQAIERFLRSTEHWVIEGCYSDLLRLVVPRSTEIVFMNLPVQACIANARKRPWEPHKYASREAQDANLEMLISWIAQYESRTDTFSRASHAQLYDDYTGSKTMYLSNADTAPASAGGD